jgi:hypothetical protein
MIMHGENIVAIMFYSSLIVTDVTLTHTQL